MDPDPLVRGTNPLVSGTDPADPDPHQTVTDPQHCSFYVILNNLVGEKNIFEALAISAKNPQGIKK